MRLTPTIVEVIVRAPAAARHFHPGPVLSPAELRTRQRPRAHRRSRGGAADGGHRAHRRVGRPRTGPALAHHARDGRVEPAVRVPAAGRAGRGHGPDRDADRDPGARNGAARRRRARQRGALLDRPGAARRRATACSTSPATRTATICSSARRSKRPPTRWCGPPTPAWRSCPSRPQDRHFRGNIVQAMVAYAEGRLGDRVVPLAAVDRIIAIGSDRMMHAVQGRPARRAGAAPAARPRRHRQHQLADAVHDERGLRAVPAAPRRPGDRARGVHLLLLQPGPGARPRRLRQPARRGSSRTACRRRSPTCGCCTCWRRRRRRWPTCSRPKPRRARRGAARRVD